MDALLTDTELIEYLRACGGEEVLYFASSREASDAAHELRRRAGDEVEIEASYHKVFLELPKVLEWPGEE